MRFSVLQGSPQTLRSETRTVCNPARPLQHATQPAHKLRLPTAKTMGLHYVTLAVYFMSVGTLSIRSELLFNNSSNECFCVCSLGLQLCVLHIATTRQSNPNQHSIHVSVSNHVEREAHMCQSPAMQIIFDISIHRPKIFTETRSWENKLLSTSLKIMKPTFQQ